MQNTKEKAIAIRSYILKKGLRDEIKQLAVSMLYVTYTSSFEMADKEIYDYANRIISRSVSKNSDDEGDWKEFISNLDIKKAEFPLIVKEILNASDRFNWFSPESVIELVSLVLDIQNSDSVLDLGSGYGTFLLNIAFDNMNKPIRPALYGQEINTESYYTSCMALSMCSANYHIQNVNSISNVKCPSFTKGYIFPPIGLRYDCFTSEPFKYLGNELFEFKGSYEWLFVLKALEGLNENGRIAVILPDGPLFRTQDSRIRKYLLDKKLIEGIITLPAGTFMPWTGIQTNLVVLSRGNDSFKMVNGEDILKDLPTRGLTSHEAAVDLYNAYFAENVKRIQKADIKSLDCNLTLNTLCAKGLYDGLKNLKKISDVAEVLKGCPLTLAAFMDELSNCKTPYQLLSSSNIKDGIIDYASLPYLNDGKKYEKYFLKQGDVVLTAKSTKIKFAVINDKPESTLIAIGGMIIVRPNKKFIDGTYLKIFFDSAKGKQILDSIKKGTVITTIPLGDFRNVQIPCPEVEIQTKMASKYNRLLAMYDGMIKEVESLGKRLTSFYDENCGD